MLSDKINESNFLNDFREVLSAMYSNWWAERNGGNVSIILEDEFVSKYVLDEKLGAETKLEDKFPTLANKFFLVTGTGCYFRNIINVDKTKNNCGIIKMNSDGSAYNVVWGFEGSRPTSELPSHLLSHKARLSVDPNHKVVIHSHPTNLVALTFVENLDEIEFTFNMWKTISEASVVFPEGIGIIPWMLPGSYEIGYETSKKMSTYRSVIWPHHGVFCADNSLDNAFGLLECLEKSAMIYHKILSTNKPIKQEITKENMIGMSEFFGYKLDKGKF